MTPECFSEFQREIIEPGSDRRPIVLTSCGRNCGSDCSVDVLLTHIKKLDKGGKGAARKGDITNIRAQSVRRWYGCVPGNAGASVNGMGVQRTCVTARRPGTGNELRPRLTAGEKQFGLRDSSDSILVHQLPGVGCRRRSRLVPPQARPCCARSVPRRSRSPRTAMIRRGVVSRMLREMGQPRSQHAVLRIISLPSPLCRTPPMDGAPQGRVQPLATGSAPPSRT
jgi:hypothetical protein